MRRRWLVLVLLAVVAALAYWRLGHVLSLAEWAQREESIRRWASERPLVALALAAAVYVAVTGLSLPGAAALTLAFGWLFGFWRALVLVSFASTAGATLAFLLSRYLFREAFQARFADRISRFNAALEREGAYYLFTLRLIPAVPFFVINAAMGLTPLAARTFWWVSQLGMLPGTAVYVYAGATVPSLAVLTQAGRREPIVSPQLLLAFVLLGAFPLVVKRALPALEQRWLRGSAGDSQPPSHG